MQNDLSTTREKQQSMVLGVTNIIHNQCYWSHFAYPQRAGISFWHGFYPSQSTCCGQSNTWFVKQLHD